MFLIFPIFNSLFIIPSRPSVQNFTSFRIPCFLSFACSTGRQVFQSTFKDFVVTSITKVSVENKVFI
jgi:hypothetical protein